MVSTFRIAALITTICIIGFSGCIDKTNDAGSGSIGSGSILPKQKSITNYSTSIGPYNISFVTLYNHDINVSGPKRRRTTDQTAFDEYTIKLDGGAATIYIANYYSNYMAASIEDMTKVLKIIARDNNITNFKTYPSKVDGKNAVIGTGTYLGRNITVVEYFLDSQGMCGYTLGSQSVEIVAQGIPEDELQSILNTIKIVRKR